MGTTRVYKARFSPKDDVTPDESYVEITEITMTFAIGSRSGVTPDAVVDRALHDLQLEDAMDVEFELIGKPRDKPNYPNGMYRITYTKPGGRIVLTSQMLLFEQEGDRFWFSAWPRFGTSEFERSQILTIEKVPEESPVFVNWDARKPGKPESWPYARRVR